MAVNGRGYMQQWFQFAVAIGKRQPDRPVIQRSQCLSIATIQSAGCKGFQCLHNDTDLGDTLSDSERDPFLMFLTPLFAQTAQQSGKLP